MHGIQDHKGFLERADSQFQERIEMWHVQAKRMGRDTEDSI